MSNFVFVLDSAATQMGKDGAALMVIRITWRRESLGDANQVRSIPRAAI